MTRRALSSLALLGCLCGCTVAEDAGLAKAEELPGVTSVKVVGTQFDVEDRTMDVHVLMKASSTPQDVVRVVRSYEDDLRDGDVVMLAVVVDGVHRSRLYNGPVTQEMAADLLAAAVEPEMLRYEVNDVYRGPRSIDFVLAPKGLATLASVVDERRRIKGIKTVQGVSGKFGVRWDPVNEDTRAARARLDFAIEMDRHVKLVGASIGGGTNPEYGAFTLQVAESDRTSAAEYVREHRTAGLGRGRIEIRTADPPHVPSTEVWAPPFPDDQELAELQKQAEVDDVPLIEP